MTNDPLRTLRTAPQQLCGVSVSVAPQHPIGVAARNAASNGYLAKLKERLARQAHPSTCRRCGARTLRGLDDDTAAREVHVHPDPLDLQAATAAILAGIPTFAGWRRYGGLELTHREWWRLPEGPRPLYVEHRCGIEWPTTPTPPKTVPERCPF